MRNSALGDLLLERRQSVGRRYAQHQRLQEFLLYRALPVRPRVNIDSSGRKALGLGKQVKTPEFAPHPIIDRTIAKRTPFQLQRKRAQGAGDNRRQILFYRARAAGAGLELLDALVVTAAERLPEFEYRIPQLALAEFLLAVGGEVILGQFALMVFRGLVE